MSYSRYYTCDICKKDITLVEFNTEEEITEENKVIVGMLMTSHLGMNHSSFDRTDSKTVSALFTFRDELSYEKVI